jgi:hypothetical protein
MTKLSASGMEEVKKQKAERERDIRELTANAFVSTNIEQRKKLKQYVDAFELSANQLYLFQAMGTGLQTWAGSWIVARLLPIPEFLNNLLTSFLYLGVAGYILQNFSIKDFYEQLEQMKSLYIWSVKNGQDDVDTNLSCPETQRLLKLIAPLTSSEFVISWERQSPEAQPAPGILSTGYAALSSTFSLFYRSQAKDTEHNRNKVRDLKIQAETRGFDVSVFTGFKQAMEYFASSQEFRDLLSHKFSRPINLIKSVVPSSVIENFSAPKQA